MRSLTVAATQFPVQTPTGAFDKANNAANIQAAEAVVREAAAAGAKLILVCLLMFFFSPPCFFFLHCSAVCLSIQQQHHHGARKLSTPTHLNAALPISTTGCL